MQQFWLEAIGVENTERHVLRHPLQIHEMMKNDNAFISPNYKCADFSFSPSLIQYSIHCPTISTSELMLHNYYDFVQCLQLTEDARDTITGLTNN